MNEFNNRLLELAKVLYEKGFDKGSIPSFSERLHSVQKGLSAEAEFAATVSWLGNCDAIFKLETNPATVQAGKLKAPDFIAFPIVRERRVPVLIEVKSRWKKMKAAEEYLSCLTEFATLIELPLLIAWSFRGLWLLVDHVHFAKKQRALHLSIETAFQEDLMCLLFRDVRICLNPKLQLFFEWKILDPIVLTRDEDIPQNFRATFLKAGYSHEGISLQRHPRESLHLFLAAPHEEQVLRVDDHTIRQVIRPVGESLFSLSRVLASELALGEAQNTVDWHQVLRSGALPSSGAHYRESLQASQEDAIILQWWDTQPRTLPSFLV